MTTDFKKITKGTKLSETQYYTVEKVVGNQVQIVNDSGESIVVDEPYVRKCLFSSDQFSTTKKLSRTDLTNVFLDNPGIIMTVNFNKQVDIDHVKNDLYDLYPNKGGKILSLTDFKKRVDAAIKGVLTGEERTMVGRHNRTKDNFGRIHFIDMDLPKDSSKDYDTRMRTVDPRTLNWVIVKGVKYVVK